MVSIKHFEKTVLNKHFFPLSKECPSGYYGLNCAEKCVGQCSDNYPCNHTTGLCDNGCADGWTGGNCTDGCSENLNIFFLIS